MLRDEEKTKILEEEKFRHEVRMELQKAEAGRVQKCRTFDFFNSNLGLWLLSTVVLGLLSWAYTEWEENNRDKVLIEKIDNEITARINRADGILQRGVQSGTINVEVINAIDILKGTKPVYTEFKDVPLLALLHKEKDLVDSSNRQQVLDAYELSKRLARQEPDLRRQKTDKAFKDTIFDFAKDWKKLVESQRWGLETLLSNSKSKPSVEGKVSVPKNPQKEPRAPKRSILGNAGKQKEIGDFLEKGDEYFKKGNYDLAAEEFKKALDWAPEKHIPRFAYGHALFAQEKFDDAAQSVLKGVEIRPQWAQGGRKLCGFFPDCRDFFRKLERLKQLVNNNNGNREVRFLLAYCYYFSNQREKSVLIFQELVDAYPDWSAPKAFLLPSRG